MTTTISSPETPEQRTQRYLEAGRSYCAMLNRMPVRLKLAVIQLAGVKGCFISAQRMAETRGERFAVCGYDTELKWRVRDKQHAYAVAAVGYAAFAAVLLGLKISFPAPSQKKAALEC